MRDDVIHNNYYILFCSFMLAMIWLINGANTNRSVGVLRKQVSNWCWLL